MDGGDQMNELLAMLKSENLEDRVTAAHVLADVGDDEALKALRVRMREVGKEFQALVGAIHKLKTRLGVS